jgi:hypothetical protein
MPGSVLMHSDIKKTNFGEIWEESQFYILNSQKYTYVFPSAQYICTDVSQPVYIS